MTQRLTADQVKELAHMPGARRIAVENFLGSMDMADPKMIHLANCELDAGLYRWNRATRGAIRRGIQMAYR